MRTSWFRTAHIKSEGSYRLRLILTQRSTLKRKFMDLENTIRHLLKAFGIHLGAVSRARFDTAVRESVAQDALTRDLMEAMLRAKAVLWEEYTRPSADAATHQSR